MAGGILDLVSKGIEDIYIISDAQITLFKAIYMRLINYSMYDKFIIPKASGNFSTQMTIKFEPDGDLLHKIWLVAELPEIKIKKSKPTFSRIASILSEVEITWNYSPESSDALASLYNYNGSLISEGTAITITDIGLPTKITLNSNSIIFTSGYVKINDTTMKIKNGLFNISPNLNLPLTMFPTIVNITSGKIELLDSSVFGNVFYEISGSVTIIDENNIGSFNIVAEYTNSITNTINTKIQTILNTYNFFVNLNNATTSSDYTLMQFTEVFDNINVGTNLYDKSFINTIKNINHIGRNLFMYLISHYMIRYSSDYFMIDVNTPYTYNVGIKFLPISDDNYVILNGSNVQTKQIYSTEFKNILIKFGILLGGIFHYSYDTTILNTDGETCTGSDKTFQTLPLFNDILKRARTTYEPIRFKLYSSDDIRYLFYISFINNITRLKIVSDSSQLITFNPAYATILKTASINISNDNLGSLDPDIVAIDDMVLFYHTIDSDITNYVVYQYNYGENTSVYFDNNIGSNYALYDKYNYLIPVNRGSYTDTDSYKIYKSYMQKSISNDIVNNTIKSEQQVKIIANILKYNIDSNIRFNFGQILNNISVLSKGTRTQTDHFILNFYKAFLAVGETFIPSAGASFIPVVDSSSVLLKDNFKTTLNTIVPVQVPTGIAVTNYFNDYIQDKIKTFITQCQGLLKATNYLDYLSDYSLWGRLAYSTNYPLSNAYNIGKTINSAPTPDSSVFSRIAFMNFLPLLVAKDIPRLVYDTFKLYVQQVMIEIGADTSTSSVHFDELLSAIDFRDVDDESNLTPTTESGLLKKEIYNRIIMNCFVTMYSGTNSLQIDNSKFYSELQAEKSTGSLYLLSCALRPDTFFCKYSILNTSGTSTTDILTDAGSDLSYLPVEWLTQTYYNLFLTKINNCIDAIQSISTTNANIGKALLKGILADVINSFILRSNLPTYTDYINNDYLVLGLCTETNSTIKNYKKSSTSKATASSYCDIMSSIWYQTQKGFIQQYNIIFNETLLSRNYFSSNLGSSTVAIFDYIKSILSQTNSYYDSNNPYPNSLPDSLLDSFVNVYGSNYTNNINDSVLNYVKELYPSIDTLKYSGFDFYRLSLSSQDFTKITTYVKDYSALYIFILNYYNTHKSITLVKNDNDNILYTQSGNITGIRKKDSYAFEQSSIFTAYLNDHINIKYVSPSVSTTIKNDLSNLNNYTTLYWNPDIITQSGYTRNTNGVYGVLDAIYNINLTGNIYSEINKLSIIPNGKTLSDKLDNTFNPMTTFCLREYYRSLYDFTNLTYQHLYDVTTFFNSLIYLGTTKLITSQSILKNKNLAKLYTDTNNNILSSIDIVSWFLFDLILTNANIANYADFSATLQNVYNTTTQPFNTLLFINSTPHTSITGGTLDTLQEFTIKTLDPITQNSLTKLSKITNLGPSLLDSNGFILINDLQQFIDEKNYSANTDVIFYEKSFNGLPIINTDIEIKILSLLRQTNPEFAWVRELGHKIPKKITISLAEQEVESYTPELMHLHYTLNKSVDHEIGYNNMIGNTPDFYEISGDQPLNNILYIPIDCWFSRHAGNSVPIINLIHSDLTIKIDINDLENLLYIDPNSTFITKPKLKCKILARYIYLDDDERMRIAGSKTEYLIEKYNYNPIKYFSRNNIIKSIGDITSDFSSDIKQSDISATLKINLSDPTKYFLWYIKFRDITTEQSTDIINWCDFGYNVRNSSGKLIQIKNPIKSFEIMMNGVQREVPLSELHYNHLIPYSKNTSSLGFGEYMYSFSLYPLLLQPTGTANLTEITDISININFSDEIINLLLNNKNLGMYSELWGRSYTIIRFASGMAGQVFLKA